MQKWEYFMMISDKFGMPTEDLNRFGSEGWELVNVVYLDYRMLHYYFKRPVQGIEQ